jgi:hypothetical protein
MYIYYIHAPVGSKNSRTYLYIHELMTQKSKALYKCLMIWWKLQKKMNFNLIPQA